MRPHGEITFRYQIVCLVSRLAARGYFNWTCHHLERVPLTGPVILTANHTSFFDPFFVGCGIYREVYYLARASAFRFPLGPVLRACNAIPMDREGGGLRGLLKIIDVINAGNAITLFPEGTRSVDGQIQPAKAGVGLIVIKTTGPVVPVRIFGAFEAWNRHMTFPRPFHKVTQVYGMPMDFAALRAEAKDCSKERLKDIYREVAEQIMAAIAALKKPDL